MAQFRYRAVDEHGRQVRDTIEADSLFEATGALGRKGFEILAIEVMEAAERIYEPAERRPPPAPRDVEVRLRDVPGGLVLLIIGSIFAGVAAVLIIVGFILLVAGQKAGLFLALFPLLHLAIGVGLLVHVFKRRAARSVVYRNGTAAVARVDGVGYNRKLRINGRNPYELVWSFEVDGHRYHDKQSSFDDHIMRFEPGDPIWIVYDPADPEDSAAWPPLKV